MQRGQGTFSGPYFGIDQPSDKLNLDQFRNALMELHIHLPLSESEAIYAVMADEHGLVGIIDLMREIKADPCDASGRWARSSKLTGQHQPPNDDPPSVAGVVPTRRSGYTGGGWRAPPPPPKPHRPAPPPPEKENYRVAPTRSGPYVDGANVLSSQIRMGIDEAEAPEWRKPPQLVPKVMHPRRTPSGYANGHAVHAPDVDPDADSGRWQRESIGQRRAPPALPTAPPFGSVRPSESGFTHEASIFLGGAPPEPPPAPLQPPAYTVLPSQPWLSGYNRGQQQNIMKEAWADEPVRAPAEPQECVIYPTRSSGFTHECTMCEARDPNAGKCALCRLYR